MSKALNHLNIISSRSQAKDFIHKEAALLDFKLKRKTNQTRADIKLTSSNDKGSGVLPKTK